MHRRLAPRQHRFRYRVFSMLLDLDELPQLSQDLWLFNWNRPGLFSFHDRDHGDGRPLAAWLDAVLAKEGIVADGPRQVLCYPRIFGYVFNPLSVWFCHDRGGVLQGIVYEVHNTYGERHTYAFACGSGTMPRHACGKAFFVSPFLSGDCRYRFRIEPPAGHITVTIQEEEHGAPILTASFSGTRRGLSDGALFAMLLRYPLMTLKVIAAIHYEAVRLMAKGIRRHRHAPATPQP
jgi:DUF1365 family protein